MKKIYYLGTCSTCLRIMKDLPQLLKFEKQDIKTDPISEEQLVEMYHLSGSYEILFSRRSMKYRKEELQLQQLGEQDYKKHILREYTYLKRPVVIINDQIFIGSAKRNLQALKKALENI